jgi:hypothetical protein
MEYRTLICTIGLALLSGCNKGDDGELPISIESFEQQVIDSAGTQAIDCGKVDINESPFTVNTCVSDSFILNTPFYAFYIVQGIDSNAAYAVSMSSSSVVESWSYDSYGEGSISSSVCEDPSGTFDFLGTHSDVLNCTKDDDGELPISIESFEQQVIDSAGTQAIDCGKVDINESPFTVNTCVSDSFILNIPFYAFYIVQGIDSTLAYAVSMSSSSVVESWSYDSYGEGSISSSVCENPSGTFDFFGTHSDVLNCTE